jgi:hypothetical protein
MFSYKRGFVISPQIQKDHAAVGDALQALFDACHVSAKRVNGGMAFSIADDRRLNRRLKKLFRVIEKMAAKK